MSQETEISYINQPRKEKLAYKRILWAGCRPSKVTLNERLYVGATKTIRQEILSEGLYPCLIIWDNESGERSYAEVIGRSKSLNNRKLSRN